MGFSVSAASAIIGVTILIVLEISGGTLLPATENLFQAHLNFKNRAVEIIETDFSIIQVTTTSNGTGFHDLDLIVENTGSSVIDNNHCTVLVNGSYHGFSSSSRYIYPLHNETLTIYHLSYTGNIRVKVISNQGISQYSSYIV